MKIAMFGHKRVPSREGGVEVVVQELSARMAARGHTVCCYNRGGRPADGAQPAPEKLKLWNGVRLCTVPTLDQKGLAAVTSSFFAALCAAFSAAEVVHIHAEGPAFMCWLPKLTGKRVIVTVHGLDWQRAKWKNGVGSKYIRMGERMAVRFADEIVVLSRSAQEYFASTYGRSTVRIPNGVSRPRRLPPCEIARRWGLEQDGYLLYLGRLVPEKGVHTLIEAYRGVKTGRKLVIAGGAADSSDYAARLRALAAGDERILFTGFVQGQTLAELYTSAYLYVLPSEVEGMPLSLLEAMSYGCCCVTSNIAACTEVTGEHAERFAVGSSEALCALLQRLCDDPACVAAHRRTAVDYVCSKYDWDEVTEQTLELYR